MNARGAQVDAVKSFLPVRAWAHVACAALAAIALVGCGGKVGGPGSGGDPSDGAVDGDPTYDSGLPPPDDASPPCGYGPCGPGSTCTQLCRTCSCGIDGSWSCFDDGPCGVDAGPVCPPSEPKPGTVCSGTEACTYPSSSCIGLNDSAWCDRGYWAVATTDCPPPPPPPPPSVCPAYEPTPRAPCTEAIACDWANPCGGRDYGYCDAGFWSIKSGGCSTCPSYEPKPGMSCSSDGAKCDYPNACGGTDVAYCDKVTWSVSTGPCAPPPTCPPSTPKAGSYCPTAGASCTFMSACGGEDYAYCETDHGWRVKSPCATSCPTITPADGSSCPGSGAYCTFKNSCGSEDYAYCDMGRWNVKSGCSASTCPSAAPTSGAACSPPSSTMCSYPLAGGCSTTCFCAKDSRWACYDPPCAPPPSDGGFDAWTGDGGRGI